VAEDILQASFIKAYQHLSEVRGRFDAWVFRIVANSCKDWLKNIRRTHLSYDEHDQPSSYSTAEDEMDRNELQTDPETSVQRRPQHRLCRPGWTAKRPEKDLPARTSRRRRSFGVASTARRSD